MNNYIYEYYQKITDGTIIVGEPSELAVVPLQRCVAMTRMFLSAPVAYVENKSLDGGAHLASRLDLGALAPQLIVLELWQKALLSVLFGVMDDTDHRQFREVVVIIARKNGKTLLAAAIAAYCSFLDGEYGGRIYFAAPKLEQAGLCYDGN